ncbi:hypothetical protein ACFLXL_02060 [Chloroflexota bacterium]
MGKATINIIRPTPVKQIPFRTLYGLIRGELAAFRSAGILLIQRNQAVGRGGILFSFLTA